VGHVSERRSIGRFIGDCARDAAAGCQDLRQQRNARLRHADACVEDVDYRTPRRLDKAQFQQPARGRWIARKQNLIITWACGVGKSWLVCALGQKACRDDFSVLYKRVPRMFAELETGRADGR
jgi:DNA replication protein DnaC